MATANLHAFNYGLKGSRDRDHIKKVAASVSIAPFEPKSGVKIQVSESDNSADGDNSYDPNELNKLIESLPDPSSYAGVRLIPADFEKDDDTNFHIDFITAASNLRASNYGITHADRFRTKQIAGKIIPAIATTTSLVTGLVCLELYKIIGSGEGENQRKLDDYKNGFVNLALPFFGFSEPIAPAKYKYNDTEASEWDAFVFDHDITMQELLDYFKKEHGLEVDMVSSGVTMLFSSFMARKKVDARLPMKFADIIAEVNGKEIPAHVKHIVLVVCCSDDEDENVDVPDVRIRIRA
ncbi:E1 ubiquitin-activating protein [Coemansia asiatica]|nr:E1 ubiquitin-activating protein [Coemansia asiatica]